MTKYQKKILAAKKEKQATRDFYAVKQHNERRLKLDETRKMSGHKIQRSRNEKLDRLQRNLSGMTSDVGMFPKDVPLSSGKARTSWNYYPDEKKAYIS